MSQIVSTGIIDEQKILDILREEGYFNLFRWCDKKGTSYGLHTHPHSEVRWVLSGSLQIIEGEKRYTLRPGDRLDTLPETPHSAYIPEDCCYICGSR